MTIC
jgi:hypothetical protein